MANYQLVMAYDILGAKWKETCYIGEFLGGGATADTKADAIKGLIAGRALPFRHPFCKIESISVREVGGIRKAAIRKIQQAGNGTTTGGNAPDVDGVAARVSIGCMAGVNRSMWIRGLNDALTRRDNASGNTVTAPMSAGIASYLSFLYGLNGATRVLNPRPNPANDPPGILDWNNVKSFKKHASNENWTVVQMTAATVVNPTVGTHIYFRGLPTPRFLYLRGDFVIVERDAVNGTFTIPAKWKEAEAEVTVRNTQWRLHEYTYSPWVNPGNSVVFELTTRDTKSPTAGRRGRRSPVIRRR